MTLYPKPILHLPSFSNVPGVNKSPFFALQIGGMLSGIVYELGFRQLKFLDIKIYQNYSDINYIFIPILNLLTSKLSTATSDDSLVT